MQKLSLINEQIIIEFDNKPKIFKNQIDLAYKYLQKWLVTYKDIIIQELKKDNIIITDKQFNQWVSNLNNLKSALNLTDKDKEYIERQLEEMFRNHQNDHGYRKYIVQQVNQMRADNNLIQVRNQAIMSWIQRYIQRNYQNLQQLNRQEESQEYKTSVQQEEISSTQQTDYSTFKIITLLLDDKENIFNYLS